MEITRVMFHENEKHYPCTKCDLNFRKKGVKKLGLVCGKFFWLQLAYGRTL